MYIAIGGLPPRQGHMPLGHEPAGEVVEVGAEVTDVRIGDHVVINPMAAPGGIIGNGGPSGRPVGVPADRGRAPRVSLEVIPDHIPFEVAALNEPMAVARHAVNRCRPAATDKVLIFGAGPIGLGAVLAFKSVGVQRHGGRCDRVPPREGAGDRSRRGHRLEHGERPRAAHRVARRGHGHVPRQGGHRHLPRRGGRPAVIDAALASAKTGATVGVVAVHKQPVSVDFVTVMSSEVSIVGSMGYPEEFFEVTADLVANWQKYAMIISHAIPFADVATALAKVGTPVPPTRSSSPGTDQALSPTA